MGSRLRGNGAAVLLLTPHVQQSRALARTFAPVTENAAKLSILLERATRFELATLSLGS